jgi:hypothetical protein
LFEKQLREIARRNRRRISNRRVHGMPVAIGEGMKKMNRIVLMLSILTLIVISCGEDEEMCVPVPANCTPTAPRGVYSVNYDGTVLICWVANYESDVTGYNVYRSTSLYGEYSPIGTVYIETSEPVEYCYEDLDTGNGTHYFYAVSAFDNGGAESELIVEEVVSGTPRPEGQVTLYDRDDLPAQSGFDFFPDLANESQVWNDPTTDFYFVDDANVQRFVAYRAGAQIQDYGYASNFDAVTYAPEDGWAPSGSVEAVARHMYMLKLIEGSDEHYAKLYITSVTPAAVTFYWAFQTDPGNPDLAPPAPGRGTGALTSTPKSGELPGLNTEAKLTDRFSDPPIVERATRTRDSRTGQTTE